MAAEAEKAAATDLGPQLGISPATPDIVRKPARPSGTTGADASCCTALSTAAPEPEPAGCGKVESDGFSSVLSPAGEQSQSASVCPDKVESDGFCPVPSSVEEQSQSVPEDLGEVDCAVSTQESSTLPAQAGESYGKIQQQQQQEGVANGSDASAAGPVPTPDKVEPTPRKRWKKSTKRVPRFKVMKDKIMKAKLTPKESTPGRVKKKKIQEDGTEHVGIGSSNIARRKLDLDSSESKACFSRATLMGNLRSLAKSRGLRDDPSVRMRSKRGKKRKLMIFKLQESGGSAMVPYQRTRTDASSSALVPLADFMQLATSRHGNHGKKLETKVLGLDEKALQVYDVLRKWDESDSESFEGFDIGSGPEWDEKRRNCEQCVDVFIATMYDLLGPRKFSQWGGSVIDSVVGTFLTQNVADHLSSNAFMNLAAKFPPSKRCCKAEDCSNVPPLVDGVEENLNSNEVSGIVDSVNSGFSKHVDSEKEVGYDKEINGHYGKEYRSVIESFIVGMKQTDISTLDTEHLMNLVKDKSGNPMCAEMTLRKFIATLQPKITSHWDELRKEAYRKGYNNRNSTGTSDAVDWELVLHAPTLDVAKCIAVRGQHYLMACRIQAFLKRLNDDHGSFDLDWLRYVPRESARNYLLSILGLGDKSVDCIRLLSLRHKAFPVDVNVARIVTRLGWVQLQPLDGLEFHLVNSYPIMRDVQRYLWPRLCTIDKEKLYELHCLMITFGKVMCTKINPNCSACPFSAKCKYYSSSLARLSLPPAEEHEHERSKEQTNMLTSGSLLLSNGSCSPSFQQMCLHQAEIRKTAERQPIRNCEPIIEVPPSPEHEYEEAPNEQEPYEDDLCDLEDIVPEGVQYDVEIDLSSSKHMVNNGSWTPNYGKDLVLINPQCNFGRNKKLKNIGRLRTEHNAYVLPDDHVILEEFEERVPEDPCPYLLVVISCPNDYTVKGTILIPCRTANGGKFPLNGTYFQEHEVFADYSSSRSPISIPRECLWNLERCIVYFGSSIHSITKGQTKQDIQDCFKKGYVCVRGFDRKTRYPQRLCGTLHATNVKKNEGGETRTKKGRTSPEGKSNEKASTAN